jgi:hypothetical protein
LRGLTGLPPINVKHAKTMFQTQRPVTILWDVDNAFHNAQDVEIIYIRLYVRTFIAFEGVELGEGSWK